MPSPLNGTRQTLSLERSAMAVDGEQEYGYDAVTLNPQRFNKIQRRHRDRLIKWADKNSELILVEVRNIVTADDASNVPVRTRGMPQWLVAVSACVFFIVRPRN